MNGHTSTTPIIGAGRNMFHEQTMAFADIVTIYGEATTELSSRLTRSLKRAMLIASVALVGGPVAAILVATRTTSHIALTVTLAVLGLLGLSSTIYLYLRTDGMHSSRMLELVNSGAIWDHALEQAGGMGELNTRIVFTDDLRAVNSLSEYFAANGVTESDYLTIETLAIDGFEGNLEQLVATTIGLR